jgi:gliding-associated putative ABC transporter substrate-binding component GldG
MKEAGKNYDIRGVILDSLQDPRKLSFFDVLVIAQPIKAFSKPDLYKLDQYVLNGGSLLMCIDALETRKDTAGFRALPYELNIDDFLYHYGLRLNNNMVFDRQAAGYPVKIEEKMMKRPLSVYPVITHFTEHPITDGVSTMLCKGVGSIDTVNTMANVTRVPLAYSSAQTKVEGSPVVFAVGDLLKPESYAASNYTHPPVPIAYLAEVTFTSFFGIRPIPPGVLTEGKRKKGDGKLVLISDGDVIINEVDPESQSPAPLGFYRFEHSFNPRFPLFQNKTFLLNAVDYLAEEENIIDKSDYNYRVLNEQKAKEEELKWQVINLAVPPVLIILFAVGRAFYRKRKYTR